MAPPNISYAPFNFPKTPPAPLDSLRGFLATAGGSPASSDQVDTHVILDHLTVQSSGRSIIKWITVVCRQINCPEEVSRDLRRTGHQRTPPTSTRIVALTSSSSSQPRCRNRSHASSHWRTGESNGEQERQSDFISQRDMYKNKNKPCLINVSGLHCKDGWPFFSDTVATSRIKHTIACRFDIKT